MSIFVNNLISANKITEQDRAIRMEAQKHADAAIAYELSADQYEDSGNYNLAWSYRQFAYTHVQTIPGYLQSEYLQQLTHARYLRLLTPTPIQHMATMEFVNPVNRDSSGQSISRPSKLFIDTNCNYRLGYFSNVARADERLVPSIAWIIWHNADDPTDNKITFDGRRKNRANYEFNPLTDKLMRDEYKQEIRNLLFDLDYDTRLI